LGVCSSRGMAFLGAGSSRGVAFLGVCSSRGMVFLGAGSNGRGMSNALLTGGGWRGEGFTRSWSRSWRLFVAAELEEVEPGVGVSGSPGEVTVDLVKDLRADLGSCS